MSYELLPGSSRTIASEPREHLVHEYERLQAVAMLLNAELIEAKRLGSDAKVRRLTRLRASVVAERDQVEDSIRNAPPPSVATPLYDRDSGEASARRATTPVDKRDSGEIRPPPVAEIPAPRQRIAGWSIRREASPFSLVAGTNDFRGRVDLRTAMGRHRPTIAVTAAALLVCGAVVLVWVSGGPNVRAPARSAATAPIHGRHSGSPRPSTAPQESPVRPSETTQAPVPSSTAATAPLSTPSPATASSSAHASSSVGPSTPSSSSSYPPDHMSISASSQYVAGDGSTSTISVKVTTPGGAPVNGAPVTFSVSGGSCGQVAPASTTVQGGGAQAVYTASGTSKTCTVSANETDSGQTSSSSWTSWASASLTVINQSAP